jgi:hypothetical protein
VNSAAEEQNRIVLENIQYQDDLEFKLGDTLDVKTSIALVLVVFLATQSASFLALAMPRHWHNFQIASVGLLVIAGFLAIVALWPRKYKLRLKSSEFLGWVKEVDEFYGGDKASAVKFIQSKQIEKVEKRFSINSLINERKSNAMTASFYFTMGAFILNIATLLALSTRWYF